MILELKIKNFLSFKEEATFSFEATKDKSFEDYQIVEVAPNVRILRLAIVYGANASGKSNLLTAFEFLRIFWLNIPRDKDESTGVIPFLLDESTPSLPSNLSMTFYIEGIKYIYSLELEKKKVNSEKLFIYPGTQPTLIFDRKLNGTVSEITFNQKRIKISQIAKDEMTIKCLPNMSVLAAYNQINIAIPEIEKVIQWIKTQFMQSIQPKTRLINFAKNVIVKNSSVKDYILNFISRADYNITNINIEEIIENIPDDISNNEIEQSPKEKNKLTKTEFEHKVYNKDGVAEFYKLPQSLQSDGTLRTFGLSSVIGRIVENNAFLAIDEIESSLHPKLIEFIIEDFFKQSGQSQLLLTTHYDGLLEEEDLFRKDSIWFTNKKENGSTELYSMSEFKGLNRISSLQKAYKYGKFGAIPNI